MTLSSKHNQNAGFKQFLLHQDMTTWIKHHIDDSGETPSIYPKQTNKRLQCHKKHKHNKTVVGELWVTAETNLNL